MALKRGDAIPDDSKPEAKELAYAFLKNRCRAAVARKKVKDAEIRLKDTVEVFAWRWSAEVVEPANRNPRIIKRISISIKRH